MVNVGSFHLMKMEAPRRAFLIGPKPLLEKVKGWQELPAGRKTMLELPNLGLVSSQAIKVLDGAVYEIEEAKAMEIIERFGMKLGEDGIAAEVIEGA